jgi:hypothetical protein
MDTPARISRLAVLSLLAALLGWALAAAFVAVRWGVEPPIREDVWPYLVLGAGSLILLPYALLGAAASVAASVRVGRSQGQLRGLRWSVPALLAHVLLCLPGLQVLVSLLAGLVGLLGIVLLVLLVGGPGGSPGRPLRIDGVARTGSFRLGLGRPVRLRPRAALAWAKSAASERSAVAAFEQLAEDLGAYGAPEALVSRCLRAAAQERDHTERSLGLVERFSGIRLAAREMPRPPRASLAQMAVCSLVDGVVGEGFAAALAAGAAVRVDEPEVARLLSDIAREEAEHAELSADILAWCVAHGGTEVAEAVAQVEPTPLSAGPTRPIDGGLPLVEQRLLHQRAWATGRASLASR